MRTLGILEELEFRIYTSRNPIESKHEKMWNELKNDIRISLLKEGGIENSIMLAKILEKEEKFNDSL